MKYIVDAVLNTFKFLIQIIFFHFYAIIKDISKVIGQVSFKEFGEDCLAVIQSVGFLMVLNTIAFITFVFLPQGKDVLLIVSEEVGMEETYWNLFFLVCGLILWSMVAEFVSRYAIYVTDNSGKSLSQERVTLRKELQMIISSLFLIFPFIIILVGIGVNYFNDESIESSKRMMAFGLPAAVVYMAMSIMSMLYFSSKRINREENNSGKAEPTLWYQELRNQLLALRDAINNKIGRTEAEVDWCSKLYGIYNEFVFPIRKASNFQGETRKDYQSFTENFELLPQGKKNKFPKDYTHIDKDSIVPSAFQLMKDVQVENSTSGEYRWIYRIPNSFYARLHLQVMLIVIPSLIVFFGLCFAQVSVSETIGSTTLLMLAFTCWSGIYLGIIYLDYAVFRKHPGKRTLMNRILPVISLRGLLLVGLIASSFINDDHPVREHLSNQKDERDSLRTHFVKWVKTYEKNAPGPYAYEGPDSSLFYPVVFVCAEGGALRTGAYSSMMLSFLEDELKQKPYYIDFHKLVYAYSGVSGGSLGISFFNSISYLNHPKELNMGSSKELTEKFFGRDYLAPIIGKMFYGDVLHLILPFHIERFDRAIALEKSWENGYEEVLNGKSTNIMSSNFHDIYQSRPDAPAIFLNTTEVETGRQCWISNVKTNYPEIFKGGERDLISPSRLRSGINISTAINFSTRFPLFSPAATVLKNDKNKLHYVDGGYVENTGTGTMLEVLKLLKPIMDTMRIGEAKIKPFVLVLRYNGLDSSSSKSNLNFGNEISEVMMGIYNTRASRTESAVNSLEEFIEDPRGLNGKMCELGLKMNSKNVPMNWVLSKKSLGNVKLAIVKSWTEKNKNQLNQMFFCDSTCRLTKENLNGKK